MFKSFLGQEIGTFESCDFNRKLVSDGTLEGRTCKKCDFATPFSYGYWESSCKSCDEVEPFIANADALDNFMFNAACPKK